MTMTDEEYQQTQETLIVLARIVDQINLAQFINRIERAESVGPILNPSLLQLASGKLANVKRLAVAALEFQREVRGQLAESRTQESEGRHDDRP